jgi:hypothetical protein
MGFGTMSYQTVGTAIDALLTDEELRLRFAIDPIGTLVALSLRGISLSSAEIDVFVQTDARLWFWDPDVIGDRVH